MRKALITGDRNWRDWYVIYKVLRFFKEHTGIEAIVEGEALGVDTISRVQGEKLGLAILKYPAEWSKYGKSAGPIRNKEMLDKNPDIEVVLAFHNSIHNSKGTKNMINQAIKRGLPVMLFDAMGNETVVVGEID